MISESTHSLTEFKNAPILDETNWPVWHDHFLNHVVPVLFKCAGQQIKNDAPIETTIKERPTTKDMIFSSITGIPLRPKYPRDITYFIVPVNVSTTSQPRPTTVTRSVTSSASASSTPALHDTAAAVSPAFDVALASSSAPNIVHWDTPGYWDEPLTPAAEAKFDKDTVAYEKELHFNQSQNTTMFSFLIRHITESAYMLVRQNAHFKHIEDTSDQNSYCSSLHFYRAARDSLRSGNAENKQERFVEFMNSKQGENDLATFTDTIRKGCVELIDTYATIVTNADVGKRMIRPAHVAAGVFLFGVNKEGPISHLVYETVKGNPTGKIDDLEGLMGTFLLFNNNQSRLLASSGSSIAAGRVLKAATTSTHGNATQPHVDYNICIDVGHTHKAKYHSAAACFFNPSNKSGYNKVAHDKAKADFAARKNRSSGANRSQSQQHGGKSSNTSVFTTDRYKALVALIDLTPANTVASQALSADLSEYISSGGVDIPADSPLAKEHI